MPNGKTHNKINIIVLFMILLGLFTLFDGTVLPVPARCLEVFVRQVDSLRITVFSLSYLFGTYFLSPDLDIKSQSYRRWGALKIIWRPYQKAFGHRGALHNPVLGPIIIIATLALLFSPVAMLLDLDIFELPEGIITAVLSGIVLSMEIHNLSDFIWTRIRFPKHR